MSEPLWKTEHGADYDIPAVILALVDEGLLEDSSWHNDTSPSFSREMPQTDELRLWVGHPNPQQRSVGPDGRRFIVVDYPGGGYSRTLYETDDADDAVSFVRNYIGFRLSDLRSRPIAALRIETLPRYHVLIARLEGLPFEEVRPGRFERYVTINTEYGVTKVRQHLNKCAVCKTPWPLVYAVKNEVWKAAGFGKGIVCLACLRRSLGRPLTIDDFNEQAACNELIFAFAGNDE